MAIFRFECLGRSLVGATMFVSATLTNAATLTGEISSQDPLANEVGEGWCNPEDRVEVRPFTVSQTGTYGFTNLTTDPVVQPEGENFQGFFVQINETAAHSYTPLINADTFGDSPVAAAPTGTLNAGTQYYFVAITACYDVDVNGAVAFSVDLEGDGDIDIETDTGGGGTPAAPATPVPALPLFGLLTLGGLLGLFGLRKLKK